MRRLPTIAGLTLLLVLAQGCSGDKPEKLVISGTTMGTTYTLRISQCSVNNCEQVATDITESRLSELTTQLSHYEPESDLSRFNQSDSTEWQAVPYALAEVCAAAQSVSELSGGAFDITLGAAISAWGFGSEFSQPAASPDVANLRGRAGYRDLDVRLDPPAIRKRSADLQLDLSAIAKGYAVDQLTADLLAAGITNFLIDIGGDMRTAGRRADGRYWQIGVEPVEAGGEISHIVALYNQAIATSGDYRNFYIRDGVRLSHTIDPNTAAPVQNDLASASVIADSATQADALATTLMVLGFERGLEFAEKNELAALLIKRTPSGLTTRATPLFSDYLLTRNTDTQSGSN